MKRITNIPSLKGLVDYLLLTRLLVITLLVLISRLLATYNYFTPTARIVDTLLISRLYHPHIYDIDHKHKWRHMPLQLYGRHSLESYGYRLGEYKGDFGKTSDWSEWSQEMEDYCAQDVVVTKKLCDHFHPYLTGLR